MLRQQDEKEHIVQAPAEEEYTFSVEEIIAEFRDMPQEGAACVPPHAEKAEAPRQTAGDSAAAPRVPKGAVRIAQADEDDEDDEPTVDLTGQIADEPDASEMPARAAMRRIPPLPPQEEDEEIYQDDDLDYEAPSGPRQNPFAALGAFLRRVLTPADKPKHHRAYDFDEEEYYALPAAAMSTARKARSYGARAALTLPFLLIAAYMTFGPTYALPLPFGFSYLSAPFLYTFVLILCQTLCMLLASDILAAGLFRFLTFAPTMDSVVLVSSAASLAHAVSIIAHPEWGGYLPFCAVSCATLFFALLGRSLRMSSKRRSYKAASASTSPMGVRFEPLAGRKKRFYKTQGDDVELFLQRMSGLDTMERASLLYAPLAITGMFVFAALASFGRGTPHTFLWSLAGIASAAAPFGMMLAAAMPANAVAKRLFTMGGAVAGFAGARELSRCSEAVVTDEDVFPAGAAQIHGLKVIGNFSFERVLAYAAGAIRLSGSALDRVFAELLQNQYIKPVGVSELKHYEAGGVAAVIDGNNVLVGTPHFLLRMGVTVREGLKLKSGVFVAINGALAGVFALKYQASPAVLGAFHVLKRAKVTSVLASRDFNVTSIMVEQKYGLKNMSVEYPDLAERLAMAEGEAPLSEAAAAVLSRDGMPALADCIAGGRRMYRAARRNTAISICASVLGMLLMFFLTYIGSAAAATPHNVFAYCALWLIPVLLTSFGAARY